MRTLLSTCIKKTLSIALAIVLLGSTTNFSPAPAQAAGLTMSFNTAGSANFPAGANIPFSIDTTPATTGNNTLSNPFFPDGTYTITATLPANTQIGPGTNYTVSSTTSATFNVAVGSATTLSINIIDIAPPPPPPPAPADFSLAFNTAGSTNFVPGTNIPFSINTAPLTTGNNTLDNPLFPVGTFVVSLTLPANTQVIPGTNYNVISTTSAQFTTTSGGTLDLVVNIGDIVAGPGTSTLNMSFNTAGSTNFPPGTNIPFSINTIPPTTGNNTLNSGAFPVGNFTVTATLPANTELGAGANYTVISPTTAQFTTTAGGTLNLVLNVVDSAGGGSSNLSLSFNTAGSTNFPPGTNIPFTINTIPPTTGNNTLNNPLFPVGTFTITVTLPANTQVIAGANYTVASTTSAQFTTTAGGTHNIVINIGDLGGGGGGTSNLTLGFNTAGSTNFPPGTNIPFTINTIPPTTGNNTLSNPLFPVGTFTITATLPAGTQIIAGANYTVVSTTSAQFTTTNGGVHNITINIGDTPPGTSTLNLSFNTAGSTNFPPGTNIPFTINTIPPTTGNNTLNNPLFPVGTFVVTATLPANTIVGPGANYTVLSNTSAQFTTTAGGTLNLVINIIDSPAFSFNLVIPPGGLNISEPATCDNFQVSLSSEPVAPVQVAITSSDETEALAGNTVGGITITFNPGTGTVPQNVQVCAVDDALADGPQAFTINLLSTSGDANFNGLVGVVNGSTGDDDGGGGNGSRRRGGTIPQIIFQNNLEEVKEITIEANQYASIDITGIDPAGFSPIMLYNKFDPTANSDNPADIEFVVQNQNPARATLDWTPTKLGTYDFTFHAIGDYEALDTLSVNVIASTVLPTPGPGPEVEVEPEPEVDPLARCRFADNQTESVIYLCMLGIIDGPNDNAAYGGGDKAFKYFGEQPITRAAFTKVMVNIVYEESTIEKVASLLIRNNFFPFPDVEPVAWFSKYIAVAKLDQHVDGYPGTGLFVPWNDIEISEALKVLFNTASQDNSKIDRDLDQATQDVGGEDAAWFMRYALLGFAYGGYMPTLDRDPGLIYLEKLSRQQAADLIYTTIINAGLEPKSKLSQLKEELNALREGTSESVVALR